MKFNNLVREPVTCPRPERRAVWLETCSCLAADLRRALSWDGVPVLSWKRADEDAGFSLPGLLRPEHHADRLDPLELE